MRREREVGLPDHGRVTSCRRYGSRPRRPGQAPLSSRCPHRREVRFQGGKDSGLARRRYMLLGALDTALKTATGKAAHPALAVGRRARARREGVVQRREWSGIPRARRALPSFRAVLLAALLAPIPPPLLAQSDPATADAGTARVIVKFKADSSLVSAKALSPAAATAARAAGARRAAGAAHESGCDHLGSRAGGVRQRRDVGRAGASSLPSRAASNTPCPTSAARSSPPRTIPSTPPAYPATVLKRASGTCARPRVTSGRRWTSRRHGR